jgi:hypothetical protein
MKAKTFVACVLTASALPLAPALAQNAQPSGPQGTGWYGAPNAAVPVPQVVVPGDVVVLTPIPQESASPGVTTDERYYQRDMRRDDARRPMRQRGVYDGPSWSTNPPAPPA